ncbi:MAG: hypothetical protein N4A38_00340 [Candidatus Gracilibacteria bacterium]|nr:hypothetical protein [Candidatus Gracilibacteria bacterium]
MNAIPDRTSKIRTTLDNKVNNTAEQTEEISTFVKTVLISTVEYISTVYVHSLEGQYIAILDGKSQKYFYIEKGGKNHGRKLKRLFSYKNYIFVQNERKEVFVINNED